jgi:hypothetical protein
LTEWQQASVLWEAYSNPAQSSARQSLAQTSIGFYDVTMAARPRAQHAETILGVIVGYSFDEARQHFPGVRLRTDHCISKLAKIRQRLPFEAGGRAFSLREQLTAACDQATTPAKNSRKHLDFDRLRS